MVHLVWMLWPQGNGYQSISTCLQLVVVSLEPLARKEKQHSILVDLSLWIIQLDFSIINTNGQLLPLRPSIQSINLNAFALSMVIRLRSLLETTTRSTRWNGLLTVRISTKRQPSLELEPTIKITLKGCNKQSSTWLVLCLCILQCTGPNDVIPTCDPFVSIMQSTCAITFLMKRPNSRRSNYSQVLPSLIITNSNVCMSLDAQCTCWILASKMGRRFRSGIDVLAKAYILESAKLTLQQSILF